VFASDSLNTEFLPGRTLTLTATFSDGSTATASTTVTAPVTVTSVAPNQGAQGATVPVTINGSGFVSGASVSVGAGITVSNVVVGSATQITATLTIASAAATGARNLTVTNSGGGSGTLTGGFAVTATVPGAATLTVAYNGKLRDRVGQSETALGPDGALDGTLTVTLSASGGKTVTGVRLDSTAPGTWRTSSPGTWNWVLAVAPSLDGPVLNAPGTMAVNFPVADGGSFVVFAADYLNGEFLPGRTLTLTATFSDGSAAIATTTVPGAATLTVAYNGKLRDRVGQDNTALAPDGALDGTLTVTLSASGGRTVTALRLDSDAPGIWDTDSTTYFWVLAVAPSLDGSVLNAPGTMAVNFPVADGGSFVVFASDSQNTEFLPGRTLTLTATFSDGSTATASTTVP
jgi:hypothetical protein